MRWPASGDGPRTIVEALRRHAAERPDHAAYVFLEDGETESGRLTFAETDLRARAVAAELQARGAAGQRVLICYPAGLDYVVAFLGCLYAGAIAVPCDGSARRAGPERLRLIAADARPHLVVGRAEDGGDDLDRMDLAGAASSAAGGWREPPADPGALALLQYTSGSTRTPRGVMVSHGNIMANERSIESACQTDSEATFVGWLPIFHDMGLIANMLQPAYLGSLSVLMPPTAFVAKPVRWLRAITRYRAHTSGGPNFGYDLCAARIPAEDRAGLDLSGWRCAFNGAEMVSPATMERFTRAFAPAGFRAETHFPCYGLAEATLIVTGAPRGRPPATVTADPVALRRGRLTEAAADGRGTVLAACGPAVYGSGVRVVDPETRRECPAGTIGEVWVSGTGVTKGYWNRPGETADVFGARLAGSEAGEFLRTGDLGGMAGGQLVLVGRIKDLIVIRGQNHYASDLEWTAEASHRALRPTCGAAFSVEDGGVERLVIAYEVGGKEPAGTEEVAAAIRRAVAERHGVDVHAVALVQRGGVPKTTSGKVRRQACRDAFTSGRLPLAGVSPVEPAEADRGDAGPGDRAAAPPSLAELAGLDPARRVRALAAAMLGLAASRPGARSSPGTRQVTDPVSSLGLDSLAATELQAFLQDRYGLVLPPMTFLGDLTFLEVASRGREALEAAAGPGARTGPLSREALAAGRPAQGARTGPLSLVQQALWFEHEAAPPHQPVYTLSRAVRLRGPLDYRALERASAALVRRHPALRTRFADTGGDLVQAVAAPDAAEGVLAVEDASALADGPFRARLADVAGQPFALTDENLFRMRLLRRSAGEHLLVLSAHHAVLDFWSFCLLLRDLLALHAEEAGGPPAELPPLRTSPIDQALTESAALESPRAGRSLAYWSSRLSGVPPLLDLPASRPRPRARGFRGGLFRFRVEPDVVAGLRELAARQRSTLFTVLLTAYHVLLWRYTGQPDFVAGTLASGRDSAALTDVLGCFINPVPVRATFTDPAEPFEAVLERGRHHLLQDLAHADYPFGKLVSSLRPDRLPGRPALIQTMLILQKESGPPDEGMRAVALGVEGSLRSPGLVAESVPVPQRWANLDLTVNLAEIGGGLSGVIEYDTDVLAEQDVAGLAGGLGRLLGVVAADPGVPVGGVALVDGDQRAAVVAAGEGSRRSRPAGAGVHGLVWQAAAARPDAVAVSAGAGGGGQVSYRGLVGWACGLAARLRGRGVGRECPVGVLAGRSALSPAVVLGIWQAGGVYVPLDPDWPDERLGWVMRDAGVRVVVTGGGMADRVPAGVARVEVAEVRAAGPGAAAGVHQDQAAYVMYTSGSTGRPKGVAVPHAGLVNRLAWMQEALGLDAGERVLHKTPATFDVSLWDLLWPLIAGGCVVVAAPDGHRDAGYLADLVRAERVGVAHFVPSLLGGFLAEAERTGSGVPGRVVCSGEALGAGLRDWLARVAPEAELWNLYGPTEASVDVTGWRCAPGERGPVPLGHPVANAGVHMLDARLQPVPAGVTGEICIRGVALARGYLGRPGLTAAAFVPDPLGGAGGRVYRTGDRGRRRADGAVEFLGRSDGQVKVGGVRIELGEVEEALRDVPGVAGAAVTAAGRDAERRLAGYLVPADRARPPDPADVRAALGRRLPAIMIPATFTMLDALPLTLAGKLDREQLPSAPDRAREAAGPVIPPGTPAERTLAAVWADVLAVADVGIDDDFFALGGDSIHAIRLVAQARAAGLAITVADLMRHGTVRKLAGAITGAPEPAASRPGAAEDRPGEIAPFALCPPAALERLPAGTADAYPVSHAQQALLFQRMHNPGYEVYVTSLHLRAPFSDGAMREAVARLMARHAYLRSSFDLASYDTPLQLVTERTTPPLTVLDLRRTPPGARENELAAWLHAERARGFDTARGPLARFCVHRRSDEEFQLTLTSFALDGWCSATILTEVLADYSALRRGAEPPSTTPPGGYADFVALEMAAVRSPGQRAFWSAELAGAQPCLLPRWAAGPVTGARQQRQTLPVDDAVTRKLRRLSRELSVPLKSVLLAAHLRALRLLSGRDTLVTGLEVNGRPEHSGGDRIVGVFNNIIPLRADLPRGSWADLARAAFDAETRVLPYRRYPHALLEREHQLSRLLDTMFVFTHFRVYEQAAALDGLELLGGQAPDQTYLPLTVHFNVDAQTRALRLMLDYDPRRLPAELAVAAGRYITRSLELMAADPGRSYAADALLPARERRREVVTWNRPGPGAPAGTLAGAILSQAARTPDAVAVAGGDIQLSYAAVATRSARLAGAIREAGARPGSVIGVRATRRAELVVTLLAILRSGCAYLPLDPVSPAARTRRVLAAAGVSLIIGPDAAEPDATEKEPGTRTLSWDAQPRGGSRADPPVHPAGLAYVLSTSGTTGEPKLIGIPHQAVLNYLSWSARDYARAGARRAAVHTSIGVDLTVTSLLTPLLVGGTVHLLPDGAGPEAIVGALTDGISPLLKITPAHLGAVGQSLAARGVRPAVSCIVVGGEQLRRGHLDPWRDLAPDVRVVNEYGPAEATVGCCTHETTPGGLDDPVPIGGPIPGTQAYLVDDGQLVPPGVTAELYLGGAGLAFGYLGRPGLTADRFGPDPFGPRPGARLYRTGDLCRRDAGGRLTFIGRRDRQVKVRGHRIELAEIECELGRHPEVAEAVVAARPDPRGRSRLVAYYVPASAAPPGSAGPASAGGEAGDLSPRRLAAWLARRLPPHSIPAEFVGLPRLPVTSDGKVDHAALPDPAEARRAALVDRVQRLSDAEVHELLASHGRRRLP